MASTMTPVYFLDGEYTREFRAWAYAYGSPSMRPIAAMRRFAHKNGVAVAMRADDKALIVERGDDGALHQRTIVAGWDWPGKAAGEIGAVATQVAE